MILTVYFHGPGVEWGGQVVPGEIIAHRKCGWLWLGRRIGKSILSNLNTGRCGYLIRDGDRLLEHVEATNKVLT